MNTDTPDIHGIVRLLETYDTPKLGQLREKYPQYEAYLESEGVALPAKGNAVNEYKFKLDASRTSLNTVYDKADKVLAQLLKKLKKIKRLELTNQIIILVSGAAILSMIQKEFGTNYIWIKYVPPTLILISSVITIIIKNRSESFFSGNQSLYALASNLQVSMNKAFYIREEMDIIQNIEAHYGNLDQSKAKRLIEQTNTLASDMLQTLSKISFS